MPVRVLIDESIPEQIAPHLVGCDPSTVRREGLKGLRNGVLLRAAVDRGFQVILSADQSLRDQQNLGKIGIGAVVVVGVRNRMKDLEPLVPRILVEIGLVRIGEMREVTRE